MMNNNMPMHNNPAPMPNGYPAPTQNGYPAPMQNGYPAPMQNGYPAPMQNGYPAPMQNGYPAPMQNGYPAPMRSSGAAFCWKCGAPYGNSGHCPNCGTPRSSAPRAKAPNQDLDFTLKCATGMFSSNPLGAVENAAKSRSNAVWGIIGMAESVLIGASIGTVLYKSIDIFGGLFDNIALSVILTMVLVVIAQFFVSAGVAKLLFVRTRNSPSYIQIMNLHSVAFLPLAAASVIALIFAFISPLISLAFLLLGLFVSMIAAYFGYQKAASFTSSPFWLFAAVLAIEIISFVLLVFVSSLLVGAITASACARSYYSYF